jgi:hypothetical protein
MSAGHLLSQSCVTYGYSLHGQVYHGDYGDHLDNVVIVNRLLRQRMAGVCDSVRRSLTLLIEPIGELCAAISTIFSPGSAVLTKPVTTLTRRCMKSTF